MKNKYVEVAAAWKKQTRDGKEILSAAFKEEIPAGSNVVFFAIKEKWNPRMPDYRAYRLVQEDENETHQFDLNLEDTDEVLGPVTSS